MTTTPTSVRIGERVERTNDRHPGHSHPDHVAAGHVVTRTEWATIDGEFRCWQTDLAYFPHPPRPFRWTSAYTDALALAQQIRRDAGAQAYAVIDTVWADGCRSHG